MLYLRKLLSRMKLDKFCFIFTKVITILWCKLILILLSFFSGYTWPAIFMIKCSKSNVSRPVAVLNSSFVVIKSVNRGTKSPLFADTPKSEVVDPMEVWSILFADTSSWWSSWWDSSCCSSCCLSRCSFRFSTEIGISIVASAIRGRFVLVTVAQSVHLSERSFLILFFSWEILPGRLLNGTAVAFKIIFLQR